MSIQEMSFFFLAEVCILWGLIGKVIFIVGFLFFFSFNLNGIMK